MENKQTLEGVKCIVNSCQYHQEGNRCSAKSILVEPKNAKSSDDTDCSTFKPVIS